MRWPGVEPATSRLQVQHSTATLPSHQTLPQTPLGIPQRRPLTGFEGVLLLKEGKGMRGGGNGRGRGTKRRKGKEEGKKGRGVASRLLARSSPLLEWVAVRKRRVI